MESRPISPRLPEPRVRGAGESSDREQRSGQDRRREAFREARKKAAAEPTAAPTAVSGSPRPKRGANPGSRARASAPDETDARGRKLDIRV